MLAPWRFQYGCPVAAAQEWLPTGTDQAVLGFSAQPFPGTHPVFHPCQQRLVFKPPCLDHFKGRTQVGIGRPQPESAVFFRNLLNWHYRDFLNCHGGIWKVASRFVTPGWIRHNDMEWSRWEL